MPFELDAFDTGVLQEDFVFDAPVTMTLTYVSDEVTKSDAVESEILLMVEENGVWVDAATTCSPTSTYTRDIENNRVSVEICHLSRYSWFAPLSPSAVNLSATTITQPTTPFTWFIVPFLLAFATFLLGVWVVLKERA